MEQRHVILEFAPLGGSKGDTKSIFEGTTAQQGLSVTVDMLSERGARAIQRDPSRNRLVAPEMPIRLFPAREDAATDAEPTPWGVKAVRADCGEELDGRGVVVAVLDTGIDVAHPAFSGVDLVRENFTEEDGNDKSGHGTHCAGTIFGRPVQGRSIGVAPGVSRALIGKVLGAGGGTTATLFRAIQWAVESGAQVISMSLGFDYPGAAARLQDAGLPKDIAAARALEAFVANVELFSRLAEFVEGRSRLFQSTVIVAASGNESRRDVNPRYTVGAAPPAASEKLLAVGAVGRGPAGLSVAAFSNTGVDLVAPGVGVVSARAGGELIAMSGTSMAAPHVAGVAALWIQHLGASANPTTLRKRLEGRSVTEPLAPGFHIEDVGQGLVQAPQPSAMPRK